MENATLVRHHPQVGHMRETHTAPRVGGITIDGYITKIPLLAYVELGVAMAPIHFEK